MKNVCFFISFFLLVGLSSINSQEYSFINEVITPYEKDIPIHLDRIYLRNNFIVLGKQNVNLKSLNKETFKLWWGYRDNNIPPLELFLKNFDLEYFKLEIVKSLSDSKIDFSQLKEYFHSSDEEYVKSNPKNNYLSISRPYFNKAKDWCVIVKSQYTPFVSAGGGGVMEIYVRIDCKWILYNTITLWLS